MAEATDRARGRDVCAFGLMQIDAILLALSVDTIREVVPGRATYEPLPIAAPGLRGALNLRDAIIPVLDLRVALGLPGAAPATHVVVIMRWEGKLLGLLVDRVCGMARVNRADLHALETIADAGTPLATHGFIREDQIAVLLDAARIAALPGIPIVSEDAGFARRPSAELSAPLLLFSVGNAHFGIEALHVDATVPKAPIRRGPLTGGTCLGIIEHQGHEVPLVDTLAALGMGKGQHPVESQVMVLRYPDGMLGFVLDDVRHIRRVPKHEILPMPPLPIGDGGLFQGMLADEGGRQYLLLDADAMRSHFPFVVLAQLRNPIPASVDPGKPSVVRGVQKGAGPRRPYLTYLVQQREHTSPLIDIAEILTFPSAVVPFEGRSDGLLGLFNHRGVAIPLVCIATYLGQEAAPHTEDTRVLLVRDGDNCVGFVVAAARSIETVAQEAPAVEIPAGSLQPALALALIGEGSKRRMVPCMSFIDHVRRISTQTQRRDSTPVEARAGIEPACKDLQSSA